MFQIGKPDVMTNIHIFLLSHFPIDNLQKNVQKITLLHWLLADQFIRSFSYSPNSEEREN